jgi:hypothetical protein
MNGGRTLIVAAWLGIFIYGYLNAMLGTVLPNLMENSGWRSRRPVLFSCSVLSA